MREIAERVYRGRMAIALARKRGLDTADWERCLGELFTEAGRKPTWEEGLEPWMLWEWRRISIPQWQDILEDSVANGDKKREDYARWMLRDILLDPEYEEPQA